MDEVSTIYRELKFKTLLEKITPQAAEEPKEAIEVTIVTELLDKLIYQMRWQSMLK